MILVREGNRYIFDCTFDERVVAKHAGFRWDAVRKQWWTDRADIACKLVQYANADVAAMLAGHAVQRQTTLAASRALDSNFQVPCPPGLAYRPYQLAGIEGCLRFGSFLLGDDTGTGKTIMGAGIINADQNIESVLIICPNNLKYNWRDELTKWLVRPLTVAMTDDVFPHTNVVIINFEALVKHSQSIRGRAWDCILVDEAHKAKNPKAQRTQQICGFKEKNPDTRKYEWVLPPLDARIKGAMTGTPLPNCPIEAQPILGWLNPKEFGDFFRYALRYCNAHQNNFGWDFSGASHLDELQERLRLTCMVRRLKADVLPELPPKERQILTIPATRDQRAAIDAELDAFSAHEAELADLQALVALSAASDDPEDYKRAAAQLRDRMQIAFTDMAAFAHRTALIKAPSVVEHCIDLLETQSKIIVFAHHQDVVNALMQGLAAYQPVMITGAVKSLEDRNAAVQRFQNDPTCRVFVGGISVAGVGLTLTAASTVVFAELDWVPANMTQCEDRAHRISQQDSVLVQHVVLEDSLDARKAARLIQKQAVADAALDDAPVVPTIEAPITATPKELAAVPAMAPDTVATVHAQLRYLAERCNYAATEDGAGFNKLDARIGHSLAEAHRLTPKQAALGLKLTHKYRRQLAARWPGV